MTDKTDSLVVLVCTFSFSPQQLLLKNTFNFLKNIITM